MYTLILVVLFKTSVAVTAISGFTQADCKQASIEMNQFQDYHAHCVKGGVDGDLRVTR
jgi:hypothetical protein